MRRLVLVCLLLILPVQWSWATTASVCRHDAGCGMQHEAQLDGAQTLAGSADGDTAADASSDGADLGCSADCSHCQGPGLTALISVPAALAAAAGSLGSSVYVCRIADHVPDDPLRPPSAPLA